MSSERSKLLAAAGLTAVVVGGALLWTRKSRTIKPKTGPYVGTPMGAYDAVIVGAGVGGESGLKHHLAFVSDSCRAPRFRLRRRPKTNARGRHAVRGPVRDPPCATRLPAPSAATHACPHLPTHHSPLPPPAGPSGAVAAWYLAKGGARVALLDKEHFPRDKICGDAVCTPAINILEEMGVIKELVEHDEAKFADNGGFISPSGLAYIGGQGWGGQRWGAGGVALQVGARQHSGSWGAALVGGVPCRAVLCVAHAVPCVACGRAP